MWEEVSADGPLIIQLWSIQVLGSLRMNSEEFWESDNVSVTLIYSREIGGANEG